jgi:hypothetical protein
MIKTLALLSLTAAVAFASPEEDRVLTMPGWNDDKEFPFRMYSGYLNVPGTTRNLHYMFVEAQSGPKDAPVVVWFNGGPGCSSMMGML